MTQDRIALLIDADNVSLDVIEQAIAWTAKHYGGPHLRRAYGTPEAAVKHQAAFKRMSIRPMVNLAAGKNSTDIALAVDAIEIAVTERPNVFVIVSSDSDFAPVVTRLRERGCRVVGLGQQGKVGQETVGIYDDYEVLKHHADDSGSTNASSRTVAAKRTRATAAKKPPAAKKAPAKKVAAKKTTGTRATAAAKDAAAKDVAAKDVAAIDAASKAASSVSLRESAPQPARPSARPSARSATTTTANTTASEPTAAKKTPQRTRSAGTSTRSAKSAAAKANRAAAEAAHDSLAAEAAHDALAAEAALDSLAGVALDASAATRTTSPRFARGGRGRGRGREGDAAPQAMNNPRGGQANFGVDALFQALPELARGGTLMLNDVGQRLRAAKLLGKSGSSIRLLKQFPDHVMLEPEDKPIRVRAVPR